MTSLVLGAFAVMFLIILINLSGNLNTLLDITRMSQENFESSDGGTGDEARTPGIKEIGGNLFRGKIPEMAASEKIQKKIPDSEAKPPSKRTSLE